MKRQVLLALAVATLLAMLPGTVAAQGATITVNDTGDTNSRDNVLTLREAILLATGGLAVGDLDSGECAQVSNSTYTPPCSTTDTIGAGSADTITFDGGVFSPGTINLTAGLPGLSTGNDTVDGSAAGVVVSGGSQNFWCFGLSSGHNVIRGLEIRECTVGIFMYGSAYGNTIGGSGAGQGNVIVANSSAGIGMYWRSVNNLVIGNYVGTNAGGTLGLGNEVGIDVGEGAHDNVIGGSSAGEMNVISGNWNDGVLIEGTSASHNRIIGNHIGTDEAGTAAIANGQNGVSIWFGAWANTIGGWNAGEGNLISGNSSNGVDIQNTGTFGNRVVDDYIGTDVNGNDPLPNGSAGVSVHNGAQNTIIDGNLLSGNSWVGINFSDSGTSGNSATDNLIGTDISGNAALPNSNGVNIYDAENNTLGSGNVISGNSGAGVQISGSDNYGNLMVGSFIGTTADGTAALPNGSVGVLVDQGAHDNYIGTGKAGGPPNVISGNTTGVSIQDADTTANSVANNYIGTNPNADGPLPNNNGVLIRNGAHDNSIDGNIVSGNTNWGVVVEDAGSNGNQVTGNNIGTGWAGGVPVPNDIGVVIWNGAQDNTIGPGNVISFNTSGGVGFVFSNTTGNRVVGNYVTMNDFAGVSAGYSSGGNSIGGSDAADRNVISGNSGPGVRLSDNSWGFEVTGNLIGTDFGGTGPWPNDGPGVLLESGANHNTIGGPGEGNVIAFNNSDGVLVDGGSTTFNAVRGNSIHSNTGMGIENINGGNSEIAGPNIAGQNPVTGTTCPNCTVDIYTDLEDEGKYYEGSAVAGVGGNFTFAGTLFGPYLTATTTDTSGNTSEFTAPIEVMDTGDDDMDGVPNYLDACPTLAEDIDANKDSDGCPDPDNDGDGFPDTTDQCPGTDWTAGPNGIHCEGPTSDDNVNTCEDYDGVLDTDGCHDSPGEDYDLDGLTDDDETFVYWTKPDDPDSDGDGLTDGEEVLTYFTCPADGANLAELPQCVGVADARDTDGGGVPDGEEVLVRGTNPLDPSDDGCPGDADCDGVADATDNCPAVYNPGQENTDSAPIPSGANIVGDFRANPDKDAQGDACDTDDDNDGPDANDGLYTDAEEATGCGSFLPTNALAKDSDGDRVIDGWECKMGTDPNNPADRPMCTDLTDTDGDGISDCVEESGYGTSPLSTDTDGDSSGNDGCQDDKQIVDVNDDGQANFLDVTAVARIAFTPGPFDPVSVAVADIDKNGFNNILDVQTAAKNSTLVEPHSPC